MTNSPSDNRRSQEQMYGHIPLTPEEEAEAILEGKKKKYFKEKHHPYWLDKEKQKPKDDDQRR